MDLTDNEVSASITCRFGQSLAFVLIAENRSEGMAMSSIAVRVLNATVYRSSQSALACYV